MKVEKYGHLRKAPKGVTYKPVVDASFFGQVPPSDSGHNIFNRPFMLSWAPEIKARPDVVAHLVENKAMVWRVECVERRSASLTRQAGVQSALPRAGRKRGRRRRQAMLAQRIRRRLGSARRRFGCGQAHSQGCGDGHQARSQGPAGRQVHGSLPGPFSSWLGLISAGAGAC